MKSIYLAGPITGLEYAGANDWRAFVHSRLNTGDSLKILSPMRNKDYLAGKGVITAEGYQDTVLSNAKAIVTRDRNDTMKCDVVIMNLLGATRVSIGTMIELGWADAARVPVILIMEPGNVHEHAMVTEMVGFRVNTVEEAMGIALTVLG